MTLRDTTRPKWYDYVCLHDEKTIDRDLLTRKQHEELLATPRPVFGPPSAPPRGKKTFCKFPKIWPPRIDQLALPTVKAMEAVLEHFNQTLEPMRIVRLVKLIHTKETERPQRPAKPKKEKVPKKKRKKTKKKECLKAWLKKQSKKSAKLIVNTVRERKAATPNYRQLLVAISLMKAMKIKKKKQLPRYTKQYLMKICEQLAIICDTEWAPYKRIPEAVPLKPIESVVSRRHIFWRLRPFEEEEEVEISMELEEEEVDEEKVHVKREPTEELIPKEERVSIKEEVSSMSEIGEGSTHEEEYRDYERELEKELEDLGVGKEAEGAADFTTDEEDEDEEKPPVEAVEVENVEEGNVQDGMAIEKSEEEEGQGGEKEEGEDDAVADEKLEGEIEEEQDELPDEAGPAEEKLLDEEGEGEVTTEEATDEMEGGVKSEGGPATEEGERDTVAPEDSDFEPLTEEEEEEGVAETEKEDDVAEDEEKIVEEEEEEEEEEEGEEEEGEETSEEEKREKKMKMDIAKKKEKPTEKEKPKKIQAKLLKKEKAEPVFEDLSEVESETESEVEGIEEPLAEVVEEHPPNTVSYLSWNIYSHWLEEFARNIQTYGKCLHNFRTILEAGTNVQADKIRTILTNWSTYLNESMKFEQSMSKYFKGKKMTKCAKCGDYTLYNIPKDHEIPDELKEAAKSTGRWKNLLEEAEDLCRSFSAVSEDTISLISHESIDVTESYAPTTSETSMYVVEDYSPTRR